MLEFVLVAEGKNDEQVIPCLVNRILCEKGDDWIKANFDQDPECLWKYVALETDSAFRYTKWTRIKSLGDAYKNKLRITHRPTDGYRTAETRKALALYNLLRKDYPANALILSRDLDTHPDEHRQSMETVRAENTLPIPVLLATPNRVVEAWMLHGFEAENDHEQNQLKSVRQQFGFDPRTHGHQLNADQAKEIIGLLISDAHSNKDMNRREQCWAKTDLGLLRQRGENSFLKHFLEEVEDILLFQLTGKTHNPN